MCSLCTLILFSVTLDHTMAILQNALRTTQSPVPEKEDLITYLTTESSRPLEHICRGGSVCDYDVIQNNRRAFMEGDSWVFPTYYPLTAGILRNCTTPDFRKAHRKLNPSNLKCLTVVPRTTIMPQRVDTNEFQLVVGTYFMTRKNYKEMKRKKITTVIIPINAHSDVNDPYAIPLVATIFHYEPVVGCVLNIPNSTAKIMYVTERETHMSRMAYSVRGALLEKSGVYKYTCSGMQSIGGHRFRKIMSVSLDLKFVLDPWITIEGQDDYIVLLPPDSGGRFMVDIYTTAAISSLDVADKEDITRQISVRFLSFSIFEVVAKFEITLPEEEGMREGAYTIHVTNDEGRTAMEEVRVLQVDRLVVQVIPNRMETVEGFVASIDCIAQGNVVNDIRWSRDYEPLDYDQYLYRMELNESHDFKRLRILFIAVQLNHSGIYICTVSNAFETVEKTLELIVWPHEDVFLYQVLYATDQHTIDSLSVSAEDLVKLREDFGPPLVPGHLGRSVLVMSMMSAVLYGVSAMVVLVLTCCVWRLSSATRKRKLDTYLSRDSMDDFTRAREDLVPGDASTVTSFESALSSLEDSLETAHSDFNPATQGSGRRLEVSSVTRKNRTGPSYAAGHSEVSSAEQPRSIFAAGHSEVSSAELPGGRHSKVSSAERPRSIYAAGHSVVSSAERPRGRHSKVSSAERPGGRHSEVSSAIKKELARSL